MSVEEKIKLNLKALTPVKKDESPQDNSTIALQEENTISKGSENISDSDISSSGKSDNTIKENTENNTASQNDTVSKSHIISFADLKKQIDKKNNANVSNDIPEELPNSPENIIPENSVLEEEDLNEESIKLENSAGATSQEKSDSAIKDSKNTPEISHENTSQTPLEDIPTDDHAKSDKAALENAQKTKEILKERDNIKKKKKSIFSMFSKNKSKKTDSAKSNDNTIKTVADEEDKKIPNETSVEKKEVKSEPEKIHFSNYESHFKKESTNFLKRFQKFKYTPSTRIGLIMGLIGLTVFIIASLMLVFPEKHSLTIYKASLLDMVGKGPEPVVEEIITPPVVTPQQVEEVVEEVEPEDDNNENNEVENGNENTVNEAQISSEEKSKEKLRQHLYNKYK